MSSWLLRPYPHKTYRMKEFRKGHLIAVGWPEVGSLEGLAPDDLEARLVEAHPKESAAWITRSKRDLLTFRDDVAVGDLVLVMPNAADAKADRLSVGRVESPYRYQEDCPGYVHQRAVSWVAYFVDAATIPKSVKKGLTHGTTLLAAPPDELEALAQDKGWI